MDKKGVKKKGGGRKSARLPRENEEKMLYPSFYYYAIIHIIIKASLGSRFSLGIMNHKATVSANASALTDFVWHVTNSFN
jgi:hypothetical protein